MAARTGYFRRIAVLVATLLACALAAEAAAAPDSVELVGKMDGDHQQVQTRQDMQAIGADVPKVVPPSDAKKSPKLERAHDYSAFRTMMAHLEAAASAPADEEAQWEGQEQLLVQEQMIGESSVASRQEDASISPGAGPARAPIVPRRLEDESRPMAALRAFAPTLALAAREEDAGEDAAGTAYKVIVGVVSLQIIVVSVAVSIAVVRFRHYTTSAAARRLPDDRFDVQCRALDAGAASPATGYGTMSGESHSDSADSSASGSSGDEA